MVELSGFYKLTIEERLKLLRKECGLDDADVALLKKAGTLSIDMADNMIENVVGTVSLPLGLATNFKINGKEVLVPMAIEEPSVVAAASKAAKLALPDGFTAEADESTMTGQIQIVGVEDQKEALRNFEKHKDEILSLAAEHSKHLEKYGGGVRGMRIRPLKTKRGEMLIIEFDVNVCDAMGANMINSLLEAISPAIAEHVGGKIRLRVLTNLAVRRLARASAVWKKGIIGEESVEGVLDGYAFASADMFRCATHNKGIMNGIDAVAVATGNDWRAVEAGAHAYAAMNGYKPLTKYEKNKDGDLVGSIELPLAVATVGGAIGSLETAKIALKIIGVKGARELAAIMACVGLANNFAALYALSTEGIQKGHMKLHARNIAISAGAKNDKEINDVVEVLTKNRNFSLDFAKDALERVRKSKR